MKTLTVKLPSRLLSWVEREARRVNQPKSALVRRILEQHQQQQQRSALDMAADLCGCVDSGLRDLSRNKKYLKAVGRSKRFKAKARPMGLRADVDPSRLNQLADELEIDAFIARTKRSKR